MIRKRELKLSSAFEVKHNGSFTDLVHGKTGYRLCCSPASETGSGADEYTILDKDYEPIEGHEELAMPNSEFQHAVQKFEKLTGDEVDMETISKLSLEKSSSVETSETIDGDFSVTNDLGSFKNLLCFSKNVMLCFSPEDETGSGKDEYTILDLSYNPVYGYESWATPTSNVKEAIKHFEEYIGQEIPVNILSKFLPNRQENSANEVNDYLVVRESGGFCNLVHKPTSIMLTASPKEETESGNNEYNILTVDFEPVEGHEDEAEISTDFETKLKALEKITGSDVPPEIKHEFMVKFGIS